MRIAIASGKGGTGKTTVATHLAFEGAIGRRRVHLVDCDVEAPNCHLFLQPRWTRRRDAMAYVPVIDSTRCTGCGECASVCQFNALASLPNDVLVFPELCHGCGGCELVCPENCITSGVRVIGEIAEGTAGSIGLTRGTLRVGEAMSPPLIRQAIASAPEVDLVILDAPPGTSCPVVTTVQQADYVVLVTEPTPFGLHDLKLAVDMVRHLGLPCGVVVNRARPGADSVRDYCRTENLNLLAEVPDDRRVAEAYATGHLAGRVVSEFSASMAMILAQVLVAATEVTS